MYFHETQQPRLVTLLSKLFSHPEGLGRNFIWNARVLPVLYMFTENNLLSNTWLTTSHGTVTSERCRFVWVVHANIRVAKAQLAWRAVRLTAMSIASQRVLGYCNNWSSYTVGFRLNSSGLQPNQNGWWLPRIFHDSRALLIQQQTPCSYQSTFCEPDR
jgi:hypothetical protein